MIRPPKPKPREDKVSLWRYARLFRADILSAQPARLYRAKMAEFRTPFFRSFLLNQPDLIETVLRTRPRDFPKSSRISGGLRPLLGESVFLTNGEVWERQRRIIDPAFEGGRLRDTYPAMWAAGEAMQERLSSGAQEVEQITSHVAADVIFRTLFSIPIEDELAAQVFEKFRAYQRSQPILNLAAFLPLPRWMPRFHKQSTSAAAGEIRDLITALVERRAAEIREGRAPDDLATKIMTMTDPETGLTFSPEEMVDQVAIFFLAGHETSASALAWALYLVALAPEWQDRIAAEAEGLGPDFSSVSRLKQARDVFREALRLYPPVPMMVRQSACPERFRDRDIPIGAQLVLSPWHLHRHEQIWDNPDVFDPARWHTENGKRCQREAYLPFSAGPRVCPGAGFAMIEGPLLLAMLLARFRVDTVPGRDPEPLAHLTVRAKDGIWLKLRERA